MLQDCSLLSDQYEGVVCQKSKSEPEKGNRQRARLTLDSPLNEEYRPPACSRVGKTCIRNTCFANTSMRAAGTLERPYDTNQSN